MADGQVDVKIVTVDAVANLNDLKEQIKKAKDNLATLNLGSKEYQAQLKQVIEGQNLLRAAMNGTTATAEHLKDAIDQEGTSYNSLVNQMANLKREFRAATTEAERADVGGRIKAINDELKRMDAMKGDFQRNVGDYFNQVTAPMKEIIKDLPSGLNAIKGPMDDVTKSLGLMGKQPILGILGLLAPLISEIAQGVKENDKALAGVKKLLDALKPVMDFFSGILQDVVEYVGDLITQAASFLSSSGILNQIIQGVMGVGNAILKFVIAPFKGIVEAIKVFKEEGVKGIGNAAKAFGQEMKAGVAFKENYQSGVTFADTIVAGAKSRKPGKEVAKDIKKDLEEELMTADDLEKIWEKAMSKMLSKMREKYSFDKEMQGVIDEQNALIEAEVEQYIAALEEEMQAEERAREMEVKMAKEAAKQKMDTMQAYASGVSSLTSSLADLMENEGKSAKNLRIASATIDMISGAVTAFSTAQQLGPIAGPIVGAINAAAVIAAGLANIAKIRATNVSKDSTPSTQAPETPTVSAPSLDTAVPTTTVVSGASTEAALNRAMEPNPVYILQSELEASALASKVQVEESSF